MATIRANIACPAGKEKGHVVVAEIDPTREQNVIENCGFLSGRFTCRTPIELALDGNAEYLATIEAGKLFNARVSGDRCLLGRSAFSRKIHSDDLKPQADTRQDDDGERPLSPEWQRRLGLAWEYIEEREIGIINAVNNFTGSNGFGLRGLYGRAERVDVEKSYQHKWIAVGAFLPSGEAKDHHFYDDSVGSYEVPALTDVRHIKLLSPQQLLAIEDMASEIAKNHNLHRSQPTQIWSDEGIFISMFGLNPKLREFH